MILRPGSSSETVHKCVLHSQQKRKFFSSTPTSPFYDRPKPFAMIPSKIKTLSAALLTAASVHAAQRFGCSTTSSQLGIKEGNAKARLLNLNTVAILEY